jgi:hypothetical protein
LLSEHDDNGLVIRPSKSATIWIDKRFAYSVEASPSLSIVLPEQATSKAPPKQGVFLEALLGSQLVSSLQGPSRLDCVFIGTETTLRGEIQGTRLGVPALNGEVIEGNFQEVLRVRRLAPKFGGFRSDVLSAKGKRRKGEWSGPPGVVIFDGVAGYLNHGANWSNSARIILLDRTDRRLNDAVAEINREYLRRSSDELVLDHDALNLPGAEALLYEICPR